MLDNVEQDNRSLRAELLGSYRKGWILVGAFISAFLIWGTQVQLPKAVQVSGKIQPTIPSIKIQLPYPVRLAKVVVRDGGRVDRGDLLFRIEASELETQHAAMQRDLASLRLERQRLLAITADEDHISLDDTLQREVDRLGMYEEQQLAEERLSIWRQRLSLLGSTQGRNSEMLIALREREAQRAELVETNRAIRNHVIQIEQIAREIRATKITSPAAGTAVLETSMAPGTFIPTSKTVLEIIPDSDRFVFELEVKQRHLKHLQVGRQVSLTIDDNRSDTPEMTTEVVRVLPVADANGTAPDRLYLATLKPFEKSNEAGRFTHRGSAALQPGQFVSVQIQTGSGTLVEYLLAPFLRTFERSFTED